MRSVLLCAVVLLLAQSSLDAEDFRVGQSIFLKLDAVDNVRNEPLDLRRMGFPIRVAEVEGDRLRVGADWVQKDYALTAEDAVPYFTDVLKASPKRIDVLSMRSVAWLAKGNEKEAIEDLTEVVSLAPESDAAFANRGRVFMKANELDAAIADFSTAIKLAPNERAATLFLVRADAWHRKGEIENAIQDCNAGLLFDATVADLYGLRALGHWKCRRLDEALADFDKALELDPSLSKYYFKRGCVRLERGDFQEGIGDIDEGSRRDPFLNDPQAYFARGRCWVGLGQPGKALADFDAAIKLNSKEAQYLRARGLAHSELGEFDLAVADLSAALELAPDDLEIAVERTDALIRKGDEDKALAELNRVVSKTSESDDMSTIRVYALTSRAAIHAYSGRCSQALADLHESIEIEPDNDRPYVILTRILACWAEPQFRDGAMAVMYGAKACELTGGKSSDALNCLAMAYAEQEDFARAVEYQERAILLAPQSRPLRKQLEQFKANQPWRMAVKQSPRERR
jgi:tetratricopeptide (TPR) repeat protein